ncbi:TonB-dependent receptor [Massilia sp. TS11]|uniref:TonB-dependent receptor n=1 Tax=Massilia sp. TS11 TaxID=2908003 RepID=UPI001EDB3D8C|nr:TonB-dependent receptor [Massilia sp. TS11]MCG2585891.1 TonB-dependent receptor [Massilia sp. TS11]
MKKHTVLRPSALALALATAYAPQAWAQQATSAEPVARVVVTGSNLKRSDKEGPSPVQVLTAKDIENTGAGSVSELMKFIPAMGNDTNRDLTSGSGFAKGVSTAALRGMGSTSTLVLINGRRMVYTAYSDPNNGNSTLYDLNSIPLSAIERVEVLKDGASAVYGSDAIGGVINFITKSNYEGAQVSASYGANDNDLFNRRRYTGIWGKGDLDKDGYSFFITGEINSRNRVAIKDVTDIQYARYQELNGRFKSNYSSSVSQYPIAYRESSNGSKNFGVTQATIASRAIFNLGCPTSEQITGGTKDGLLSTSTLIGRTFCNYDVDQFSEGQSGGKDGSLLTRAEFRLSPTTSAFIEAAYNHSNRVYTGAPISIGTTSVTNFMASGVADPFQVILPVGHPDNPFSSQGYRASVQYRFVNLRGGSEVNNNTSRLLVGLRGSNFGWDWDTAVLFNQNKNENTSFGRLYLPTLRKLNTGTTLAQLSADPTIGRDVVGNGKSEVVTYDIKGTRSLFSLPGGDAQAAVVAEYRHEKIKIDPDPQVAAGNIYGLANTLIDGKRSEWGIGGEIGLPVLKSLELGLAGRYDKYEGLKGNFVPKASAKWKTTDRITMRGTYQEGFRAPALQQVTPGGAQFFLNGVWDPKRCEADQTTPKPGAVAGDCSKSIAGTGGANPDLQPEKSKQFSLGLILQLTNNFDATFDFFRIKKEGEIALGSANEALKNEDKNPGNVLRDPNPANWVLDAAGKPIPGTGVLLMVKEPWTNQGSKEIRGVDISANLTNNLGAWGRLKTTLEATYIQKYLIAEIAGNVVNNVAGARAGIWDWQLNSGYDTPKWRGSLSTSWNYDVHSVTGSINYVGPISLLRVMDGSTTYAQPFCYYGTKKPTDAAGDRNTSIPLFEAFVPDCNIPSWTTLGASYSYSGVKNWTMSLNVQNLLDTKAPYDPNQTTAGYNGQLHNNYGRYWRVSASYRFK